uniref:Uncharacterized protein n=1 Tax=Glossina brevipalpis TaxID=37001 RepID=A0A1A9WWB3_9MUSC
MYLLNIDFCEFFCDIDNPNKWRKTLWAKLQNLGSFMIRRDVDLFLWVVPKLCIIYLLPPISLTISRSNHIYSKERIDGKERSGERKSNIESFQSLGALTTNTYLDFFYESNAPLLALYLLLDDLSRSALYLAGYELMINDFCFNY